MHTNWEPYGISYAEIVALGTPTVAQLYFTQWISPVLAFAIFGLFGMTAEARASYWVVICTVGSWLGWQPTIRSESPLGIMAFGEGPQDISLDAETGYGCAIHPPHGVNNLMVIRSQSPSFVKPMSSLSVPIIHSDLEGKDVSSEGSEDYRTTSNDTA